MNNISGRKYDLDILLTIDRNFVLGSGALIKSIEAHNPNLNLLFHVVVNSDDFDLIKQRLEARLGISQNCDLRFYQFEDIPLYGKLARSQLSRRKIACCVRLIAERIVATGADRLLYLDSDIVCLGSIDEFVHLDLGDFMFAATRWHEPGYKEVLDGKFTVIDPICAGVMLINMTKWLGQLLDEKLVDFVIREDPKYTDQTALNVICAGDILFLPQRLDSFNHREQETVFLHYVAEKPWEPWNFSMDRKLLDPFRKYAQRFEPNVSRWISFRRNRESLVNFNSRRNPASRYATKWMARKMLGHGCIGAACYFLFMHIYYKIMNKGILGLLLLKSNSK